jgi:hypothetical protein
MDICLDIDTYKLYTVIYRIPTIYIYLDLIYIYLPWLQTSYPPAIKRGCLENPRTRH